VALIDTFARHGRPVPSDPAPPAEGDKTALSDAPRPDMQRRLLVTLERLLAIRATGVTEALTEAACLVAEAVDAEKAQVFLHDPASESMVAVGVNNTALARHEQAIGLDRLLIAGGGRVVDVFQSGISYLTGHADRDPMELSAMTRDLAIRSTMLAALRTEGELSGVVAVLSTVPDAFSPDDLAFLDAVAQWVGLVVQRAAATERIAQDAAQRARRQAAEELIGVLAHDLRVPLTPLRGYLGLIKSHAEHVGTGQEAIVRYAAEADTAVRRLDGMIGNLLDTGRLEGGLFHLDRRRIDLPALVRETVALMQSPGTNIRVEAPDGIGVVCGTVDAERVRQALENLLGNAVKHSPSGAPVVVSVAMETRPAGAWAVLSVRDEGPGIAPELLPRLFDRFARGAASTGLGLGLYLARGIGEAHGGALTVDAPPGEGTTFRLTLPLSPL